MQIFNFLIRKEIRKKTEVSLRLTFKNFHFESKDELENTMSKFEFHCWKKKRNLHKKTQSHFKFNIMNEIFNFPGF